MALDLSKLTKGSAAALIEPRDIFASLPNRPWSRLRVEQDQVLKIWFDRRDERDLVIKQNTGSGKTAVGLLIAQSSLNEGRGPAAYLVPDTYLVSQVIDEANNLGLRVTNDARDDGFRSSGAILVTTFDKVVNGRSTFKLAGDPYAFQIGTVVVDDAHTALANARRKFTVTVPPGHPAFDLALSVFEEDLKRQSHKNTLLLLGSDRCSPMRIPFWAWVEKHKAVTDAIRATAQDDQWKTIFFPWPLIADYLDQVVATISDRGLELRTPCPPIDLIQAFSRAQRRVYLTATLADDGVLVTELGADAGSVRRPITPERATDLGDRLIMAPLALNRNVIGDSVRELAKQFAHGDRNGDNVVDSKPINVVVLVPSDKQAALWQSFADVILHVKDMKPYTDAMSGGRHVGLVVLVNKYDGVDLPHDACRLLIIDGIPTPLDPAEQREAGALSGSNTFRVRKIQRLEQGMGRGIRDAEDHCAILLMGSDLALSLVDKADFKLFSPATRAQIDLSGQVAEQIEGEGLDQVREALGMFLDRNEIWKEASSAATAGVVYDQDGHVSAIAEARRRAWNLAAAGDPAGAATVLKSALTGVEDVERGWRLEEVAAYLHHSSAADAQVILKAAKQLNTSVLMPSVVLPPKSVKGAAVQGAACSEFLAETYPDATALQLRFQSILDDLVFDPDPNRVDAAEAAFRDLGEHLGFLATRPDKETGTGPDNHWAMTPTSNAVIELKTGTSRNPADIVKSEVDQLAGSLNWDTTTNPAATDRVPVIVARSATLDSRAHAPEGTRVITPKTLEDLKSSVRAFVSDISVAHGWKQADVVTKALASHELSAEAIIRKHSVKPIPAEG